ncbi:transposase [Bacillus aerolatus]|uniref:Transposase n=1 Tax=Bacillus aerolatus TaxID=2653354 RepID=A0A6I1FSV8_9BACI|nr:T7SS effector LXG polymorphic toxin [Bacillus aerolatus]KAB7705326.1 transposase [Bacillus aerolatus]
MIVSEGYAAVSSKVYEAATLKAAMDARKKEYSALKGQLDNLRKEMNAIATMEEEMQGDGAEAIKAFYKAQINVVDAWTEFISVQVAFFKGIAGMAEDANLSGETIVKVPFLEIETANGLSNANMMVTSQREDLQKIFDQINDILSLDMYSRETFDEHMEKAEEKRTKTIVAVNKLDSDLTSEYVKSELEEVNVIQLFSELMKASTKGGKISPIYFDSQAYENSEIYKVQDEIAQQSADYVQYKEDQAYAREMAKKAIELENRPWHEKAWDTVSTFTGEVTGYYDYKRATEGIDPVTGEKLSDAERIAAGAMALAGFIPVVGWAGRAAKGGNAIYKTAKGVNAAAHTLDAYKSTKAFDVLQQTEMGIYGLVAANGFSEYLTGEDMFGNELTEEQRKQSLFQATTITGIGAAAKYIDSRGAVKPPYSREYINGQLNKARQTLNDLGRKVGSLEVPVGFQQRSMSTGMFSVSQPGFETKTVNDLIQQFSSKTDRGVVTKGTGEADRVNDALETARAQQRSVIDAVENGALPLEKTKHKGNYGEMKMDDFFESQGYTRISSDRVTDLDDKIIKGIDGVYENSNPPPKYVIAESKYGSSRLGNTRDGRQMSDNWVEGSERLDTAVSKEVADEIRMEAILNPENVQKVLIKIDKNGSVSRHALDDAGKVQ